MHWWNEEWFCWIIQLPEWGQKISKIYGEIGFKGLWNGLATRILMVGTLTGLQWWIYDSFKTMVGLQTSGGK